MKILLSTVPDDTFSQVPIFYSDWFLRYFFYKIFLCKDLPPLNITVEDYYLYKLNKGVSIQMIAFPPSQLVFELFLPPPIQCKILTP